MKSPEIHQGVPLLLRCLLRKCGSTWVAASLDLALAAQGASRRDAQARLESMAQEYLMDALVGEDRAYAERLLLRRAPLLEWGRYYLVRFRGLLPGRSPACRPEAYVLEVPMCFWGRT